MRSNCYLLRLETSGFYFRRNLVARMGPRLTCLPPPPSLCYRFPHGRRWEMERMNETGQLAIVGRKGGD